VTRPGIDRRAGELVLASLFLEPLPERLERLRRSAREVADWGTVPLLLESHGVLVLARHNLALAGVTPPDDIRAVLAEREAVLRELDLRFRLTLERFLQETASDGVEVTLLKGASLALDLYPDAAFRSQCDLDLLVHPGDVPAASRAAGRCGLFVGVGALPVWWYRLTHFNLKLVPENSLLRKVELHWALHHPAELLTVGLEELLARRRPVEIGGVQAWTLDPVDRFVHLTTHLIRHLVHVPADAGRGSLVAVASTAGDPVRLRWILDLHAEAERLPGSVDPSALAERAREWNGDGELAWTLGWLRDGLGFAPGAEAWVESVLGALGHVPPMAVARGSALERSPGQLPSLPALDFRPVALARLPRWIVPPRRYFERRVAPGGRVAPLVLRRGSHAVRVLVSALLSLLAFPVAVLGSVVARPGRRRARRGVHAPAHVLDLAAAARALAGTSGARKR